jgi:hypothetical protein
MFLLNILIRVYSIVAVFNQVRKHCKKSVRIDKKNLKFTFYKESNMLKQKNLSDVDFGKLHRMDGTKSLHIHVRTKTTRSTKIFT